MKRGFEENIPKVRPRVRLGRMLSELDSGAQAGEDPLPAVHAGEPEMADEPVRALHDEPIHAEEVRPQIASRIAPPPVASHPRIEAEDVQVRAAIARESEVSSRGQRLREVRARAEEAAAPVSRIEAQPEHTGATPESRGPSRKETAAHKVTQLARELSAELELAADANGRLKTDLDGALAALRRAAEEARERTDERDQMSAEVEKRASAARELLGELEMLEAERDGALAQTARFSRELRESRAKQAELQESSTKARAGMEEARGQLQRLASELEARVAERDAARAELLRVRAEKDSLQEALLAARAEADEALESRTALEEIERALGAARTRVAGIR